jgi:hypothetical protein
MATMKKAQGGIGSKSSKRNIQMYKGPKGEVLSGEGKTPPFGGPKPKKGSKVFNGVTNKYDIIKKNGGTMKKAKSGGKFPDLNKDGKVTKADILKGRGVIAKKGAKIAKCKYGCK